MDAQNKKRVRRDPDTARKLILDATEAIMIEEGYAAVSSRRIAQRVGINPATIHYYYPTTDDLFMSLHRRMTDQQIAGLDLAIELDDPLRTLWKFQSDWAQTALGVEFLALSNHRKNIQHVLAKATSDARDRLAALLTHSLAGKDSAESNGEALALATILVAVARMLTNEERVGITRGHDMVRAFVDNVLLPRAEG